MIPSDENPKDSQAALDLACEILLEQQDFLLGRVGQLEQDFCDLDCLTQNERVAAVSIAMREIWAHHRSGPQPGNDVSSHPPFKGLRMYAFAWHSSVWKQQMYLKFAFAGDRLVVYSFHPSRLTI